MIRLATKQDLPAISELWMEMVSEAREDWEPDPKSWIDMGSSLFDTGIYHIVIYEVNGEILGFVDGMIFKEPSTGKNHGVAQHFYVKPEHRGTKVSADLYKEILYIGVKNKSEVLELFCFPEMEQFWKDRGFKRERLLMRRAVDV